MNTGKAVIAGLVVTIGLLAATFGFEAIAQVAGPEEVEEEHGTTDEDEIVDEEVISDEDVVGDEDEDHSDADDEVAPDDVDTEDESHEG